MCQQLKFLLILFFLIFNVLDKASHASASVGIDVCACTWELVSGSSSSSAAMQLGVNAKLKLNSMYLGFKHQSAGPEFEDPLQINGISNTERKLDFLETEFSMGYYFNRQLATFLAYKKIELNFGSQINSTLVGVGLLGKYTFNNSILIFANAAYNYGDYSLGANKGDAQVLETVAGAAIRTSLYSHINLSYKVQRLMFKRKSITDVEFEISGYSLSYNYMFW